MAIQEKNRIALVSRLAAGLGEPRREASTCSVVFQGEGRQILDGIALKVDPDVASATMSAKEPVHPVSPREEDA